MVDIFGIVHEMRKERVWMVQTEQQYICIHQCLLAVLEGKEHDPMHPMAVSNPGADHPGGAGAGPPPGAQLMGMHDNEGFEDDEGIAESGM